MSPQKSVLSFTQAVKASPKQVYRAFTNATALREWLSDDASAIAKPGGRLYLWWNNGYYTSGEYEHLEPDKAVSFTWRGRIDPANTQVKITLSEQDQDTLVSLEHSGLGNGEDWKMIREEIEKGWKISLENLASVLESGEDLRFIRRPMLGITLDDFNAEIAKKLGVPVTEGIRIDGVVEGMGAQAAGLKQDDVLVGLAGMEVTDWSSLTNALQGQQAGNTIEVAYYRGSEKQSVMMELSRRPLPEIPDTPEKLAKAAQQKYTNMENDLDNLFAGLTEENASFKPAPDAWSVKEIMAHLIHSERGWHTWMNDLVSGFEPWYDDFGGNLQGRVEATVAAYPTMTELREELRRNCDETIAFLTRLPEDFQARKGSYWRLAYNMVDEPYHFKLHLEQMRSAIESGKENE
jgi:uncharacterized protein YndB with AHSA1/START domain